MKRLPFFTKDTLDKSNAPFLIAGLGNPGREYAQNRHNVGFMCLDLLAQQLGISFRKVKNQALICDGRYQNNKIILAKPQTFMNRSGVSVDALVRFYKIPLEQLLIIHDDLDLSLGTIRLRADGGAAGQKGMKSIIEHLGSQQFPRLRIGIGRPPGRMDAAAYVLQDFSKADQLELTFTLKKAEEAVFAFVSNGIDAAMTEYNRVP